MLSPLFHSSPFAARTLASACSALIAILAIADAARSESFTGPGGPAGGSLWIGEAKYPSASQNSYTAFPNLSESLHSLTSAFYNGTGGGAIRTVDGSASISASGPTLSAAARSETDSGQPDGRSKASVYWSDTVRLAWRGIGPAPTAPTEVVMHFFLNCAFDLNPPANYYDDPPISPSYSGQVYADHHAVASGAFNSSSLPGWNPSNVSGDSWITPSGVEVGTYGAPAGLSAYGTSFDGIVALSGGSTGSFNYSASVDALATYGYTYARASMTMQSLLLSNGFTPESQGWDVVFGSGMQSPNLLTVPEIDPSGLASVLSLLVGALGLVERRSRARAHAVD